MPYFVSSIIAVVSAMVILFTRYEADDSSITTELDRMKAMFLSIDKFVNTYVETGGSMTEINFQKLSCNGILLGNIKDKYVAVNCDSNDANDTVSDDSTDDVLGAGITSTLEFPNSDVKWQLIPNKDDSSSYKLLVDIRKNNTLMSKAIFSESFSGREFCEKMLFGTKELDRTSYDSGTKDFIGSSTNKNDGLFVCIIFK